MLEKVKQRINQIVEIAPQGDIPSRVFDIFIMSLIILNVLAVIFGSVKYIDIRFHDILWQFEVLSIIVFTIEYILRLWSCTVNYEYKGSFLGRIKYALTPSLIIDFTAISPFYLAMIMPLFTTVDLRIIRVFRLFRIFRMLKVARYNDSLNTIIRVFKNKKEQIYITILVALILLIFTSSLLYFAEHEAQPDVFSSIPAAMWAGVVSLTPIGYGNAYPVTILGRLFAALSAFFGIALFALPTGILASGFTEEIKRRPKNVCPHCGKEMR